MADEPEETTADVSADASPEAPADDVVADTTATTTETPAPEPVAAERRRRRHLHRRRPWRHLRRPRRLRRRSRTPGAPTAARCVRVSSSPMPCRRPWWSPWSSGCATPVTARRCSAQEALRARRRGHGQGGRPGAGARDPSPLQAQALAPHRSGGASPMIQQESRLRVADNSGHTRCCASACSAARAGATPASATSSWPRSKTPSPGPPSRRAMWSSAWSCAPRKRSAGPTAATYGSTRTRQC